MKKRGSGISAGLFPTGMIRGGDASQAFVKVRPDGSVVLTVGSCDIGQGCKTILAQMVAEILEIDYEQVRVINDSTDIGPLSSGTFASRVTYVDGNAVVAAAREARSLLFERAAKILETDSGNLEAANARIFVKGIPDRYLTIKEVAGGSVLGMGKQIMGQGHYMREPSFPDPETGEIDPFCTLAWGAMLAEVEVDTDTGEVEVLKLVACYDVGKAINPLLVEGQIEGGAAMGLGAALMEQLHPAYPSLDFQPANLGDYAIPTAMDIPEIESVIYECPSTHGPFGAKGFGEMTTNFPSPAIINAIHDALGVWINKLPATPENVLEALAEKEGVPRKKAYSFLPIR